MGGSWEAENYAGRTSAEGSVQSAWREGSNLQQNRSRNYVYSHSKSCPRPKMLYFSWTAWTEIVGKVAQANSWSVERVKYFQMHHISNATLLSSPSFMLRGLKGYRGIRGALAGSITPLIGHSLNSLVLLNVTSEFCCTYNRRLLGCSALHVITIS